MRRRVAEWIAGVAILYWVAVIAYFALTDATFGEGIIGWWTGFFITMAPGVIPWAISAAIDRPLRPDERE